MDNTRLFLWLALLAMLWLNYDAWTRDRAPAQTSRIPPAGEVTATDDDVPEIGAPTVDAPSSEPPAADVRAPAMPVRVLTDVLDVVIDTEGGDLVRADLLDYPVHKDQPDVLVRLLDFTPSNLW